MEIKHGNILSVDQGIIVHQVNTLGVMGAGLALQIKEKYPIAFKDYKEMSEYYGNDPKYLMGKTLISDATQGIYIAHLFAQSSIGRGALRTDYKAFEDGLLELQGHIVRFGLSHLPIYFPYKIGCGLGGGDWGGVIKPLINKHFPKATIVKL